MFATKPESICVPIILILCFVLFLSVRVRGRNSQLPLINDRRWMEFTYTKAKRRYISNSKALVKLGHRTASAFRIVTDRGPRVILSAKYANEIRNHEKLDFQKALNREFLAEIPGLGPASNGGAWHEVFVGSVKKLTRTLPYWTKIMADEAASCLQQRWADQTDWHEVELMWPMVTSVAQISTRVFLGEELSRNVEWLDIAAGNTIKIFVAIDALQRWPTPLHRFVHWFLPPCREIRRQERRARSILKPLFDKRRAEKAAALQQCITPERVYDSIEWMEECADGKPYDETILELALFLAAVHTTSDLMTKVIVDLCEHPELIERLRQEITVNLGKSGWEKLALHELKLMDSVLKESQRTNPALIATMRRAATTDVQLGDGRIIKEGSIVGVSTKEMWDEGVYQEPEKYDGYRFMKLRQQEGFENKALLVSTSVEHLGFGHGKHGCPGRFFAGNMLKVILCQMLLKYDWKLVDGGFPPVKTNANFISLDHRVRISVRRRKEEIII